MSVTTNKDGKMLNETIALTWQEGDITVTETTSRSYNEQGEWTGSYITQTRVHPDGTREGVEFQQEPGEVWTSIKWVEPKGGKRAYGITKSDWPDYPRYRWRTTVEDCFDDETCASCRDFSEIYPEIFETCVSSGGTSFSCQAFARAADCCSNIIGNPTILKPEPDGYFDCAGDISIDTKTEICEEMCSLATSEDCLSNCMSLGGLGAFTFDLLDSICPEAKWEECASSDAVIEFPFVTGPEDPEGVQSLSLSESTYEHMLFGEIVLTADLWLGTPTGPF